MSVRVVNCEIFLFFNVLYRFNIGLFSPTIIVTMLRTQVFPILYTDLPEIDSIFLKRLKRRRFINEIFKRIEHVQKLDEDQSNFQLKRLNDLDQQERRLSLDNDTNVFLRHIRFLLCESIEMNLDK